MVSKPRAGAAGRAVSQRLEMGLQQFLPLSLGPRCRTDQNKMELESWLEQGSREPVRQAPPGPLSSMGTRGPEGLKHTGLDPQGQQALWLHQPRANSPWGYRAVPATHGDHHATGSITIKSRPGDPTSSPASGQTDPSLADPTWRDNGANVYRTPAQAKHTASPRSSQ